MLCKLKANVYLFKAFMLLTINLKTSELQTQTFKESKRLDYLHDEQIMHRDLSPRNILLGRDYRVKLADFSLARITGLNEKQFNPLDLYC